MSIPVLTLYSRKDCHLCDEMRMALERQRQQRRFALKLVDIDSDPELVSRFGHKVPVLMRGDREICHYVLDGAALLECLDNEVEP